MTKTFLEYFIESYNKLGKSKTFGIQKIFISITKIRSKICTNMKITEEDFNKYLISLVEKDVVNLHGAPTNVYAKIKNPFEYHGKLWIYVSMR